MNNVSDQEEEEVGEREEVKMHRFPMHRMKTIIRGEDSDLRVTQEALFILNKATVIFSFISFQLISIANTKCLGFQLFSFWLEKINVLVFAIFCLLGLQEKFLEQFTKDAYGCCVQDRKKSIAYKHLCNISNYLFFLSLVIEQYISCLGTTFPLDI